MSNLVVPDDAALQALARAVSERLRARGETLLTAESCTGGLIAKVITDLPGSSQWFDGGIVSYSNDIKQHWLGVAAETLETFGAVSAAVVIEMATGALHRAPNRASSAAAKRWAIATSGVAGPDGGTADKPVGTVWIGWAGTDHAPSASCFHFPGSRDEVRRLTVQAGLVGVLDLLGSPKAEE
jgi:nicotinamide-nucleotide amidase